MYLYIYNIFFFFFFSSRRRHTRCGRDWSSDVCSSDLSSGPGDVTATPRTIRLPYFPRLDLNQRQNLKFKLLSTRVFRANMRSTAGGTRSEERRVGKEGRSRWSPYH